MVGGGVHGYWQVVLWWGEGLMATGRLCCGGGGGAHGYWQVVLWWGEGLTLPLSIEFCMPCIYSTLVVSVQCVGHHSHNRPVQVHSNEFSSRNCIGTPVYIYIYIYLCVRTYHVRNNYVTHIVAMQPYFS